MKLSHLILQSSAVLVAAEHEDMEFVKRSFDLEARADFSYWQNWCIAGGAVIGGVGTLASGIAALITASSSSSSCTEVKAVVEDRSDFNSSGTGWQLNVTGVTEHLQATGFNISHEGWTCADEANNVYHYPDVVRNAELVLRNFTINYDSFGGFISSSDTSSETTAGTDLEERSSWDTSEVYMMYHATGSCKTLASKKNIAAAVKKAITHQSTYKREAACYTLYNNGNWLGHLKVLEMYTDSSVPSTGYLKTCAALQVLRSINKNLGDLAIADELGTRGDGSE